MKNLQRGYLFLIVVLILVIIGYFGYMYLNKPTSSRNSSQSKNDNDTKLISIDDVSAVSVTYTNPDYGFTVELPNNWKTYVDAESTSRTKKIYFGDEAMQRMIGHKWVVNVSDKSYNTKDELVEKVKLLFEGQEIEVGDVVFNGIQATKMILSSYKSKPVHIFIEGPNYVYYIVGSDSEAYKSFYTSFELVK